ncbi:hypothetical protein Tco_0836394 [Tanacetum coccineum]
MMTMQTTNQNNHPPTISQRSAAVHAPYRCRVAVAVHAPCGRVRIILLTERSMLGRLGSFRVLGLVLLLIMRPVLAAWLILYVIMPPQSSVSSVALGVVASSWPCDFLTDVTLCQERELSQLFIFPYFHHPMRGVDTCLDLNVHGFSFSKARFSHPLVFAFAFEMVGSSIYTVTSVLTQRELDHHCAAISILVELRPKLPDRNSTIKDSPEGKIGMYTCFLSVIGAAKVSHFEIMCRALGRIPTVDASVCPLSISWFGGTSVVKDPLPVDEPVDLPCVELLNDNTDVHPTLLHDDDEEMGLLDFVKSNHPFKVKIRERTLADNEVPLMNETEDRVISHSLQTISLVDHTIQDEVNVNSSKMKKRVAFISGSPPVKKARAEGIVISDSWPSTTGKSPTALWRLIRQGEQAAASSGSVAPTTEDATSSSVTPTPEHALEDALHNNVRTRPTTGLFVVLSSSYADTDIPAASQVVSLIFSSHYGTSVPAAKFAGGGHLLSAPDFETGTLSATSSHGSFVDDFYVSQTVDSATAMNVCVPNWNVTNNARVDDPIIFCSLLDNVTPPASELRIRYEHEIMTREKFERKFTDSVAVVQQRDTEVAELKVGEVASLTTQNIGLLEKVSVMELERDSLKSQHFAERAAELDARIADARRDMDNDLYPHMLTAIAGRRWVIGHGFRSAVYKCARSVECPSAMGKVISTAINNGIQQGLEAGVVHGKVGRSLALIEAYDPEVEGKYVATVSEFESISFPLLDELESLKDSPLALIMSALVLKDDQGNTDATLEFTRFQPSLDQVVVPIYSEFGSVDREMLLYGVIPSIRQSSERKGLCPPSSSTLGGASGSAPPRDSSLGVADNQVSTLVLAGDGGSANQPPVVQAHDNLFDTSVLDGAGGT